jgi:hypothetical protein
MAKLHALSMAGRCANGSERDHGKLMHAVPAENHGNGRMGKAVCGAQPGKRSAGWSDPIEGRVPTCPRCLKKLNGPSSAVNHLRNWLFMREQNTRAGYWDESAENTLRGIAGNLIAGNY